MLRSAPAPWTRPADPIDGSAVEKGQVINYKIVVTNPSGEKVTNQTLVDTVPAGVTVDVGSITPTGTYNAAARTITWKFDLAAATVDEEEETIPGSATFTYKATVDVGYTDSPVTLVNTALWVERDLSDSTSHPVKALKAVVTSFCVKDAPYYSLTITPQNGKLLLLPGGDREVVPGERPGPADRRTGQPDDGSGQVRCGLRSGNSTHQGAVRRHLHPD